jgi:3',5'-cyclic AMP phosphodiesterase CpdA
MRIAHFSDLHLLWLRGARVGDFLSKRWIGGLNLLFNRGRHYRVEVFEALVRDLAAEKVDHALCTGDITNLALEQEYVFARERFDRISLGPRDVTVIPGNHDAYVAKGVAYFTGHFADYCAGDEDWRWADGQEWPLVRVRGDVAIVGLSTSHPTPWFFAYGRVGTEQLRRLREVLGDPRLAGKFRLVAVHHPPAGARAWNLIRGLRDHRKLARAIADAGAELVLHGHEHLDVVGHLRAASGRLIRVRGIPACTYAGDRAEMRARYRIYDVGFPEVASPPSGGAVRPGPLEAGPRPILLGEEVRVWDPETRRFIGEGAARTTTA